MKKFGKFLLFLISAATVVSGVLLVLKKVVFKTDETDDDFDDFEDDMDDFEEDDDSADTREYVSIKITAPETSAEEVAETEEAPAEEDLPTE